MVLCLRQDSHTDLIHGMHALLRACSSGAPHAIIAHCWKHASGGASGISSGK